MTAPTRLQLRLSRRADQADDPPRHPQGGGDPRLPGAVRQPRDADALRLGHRRHPGHGRVIGPDDVLKVIDQGADDTTNAVSIRALLRQASPASRRRPRTAEATIIQTRHRIPETPLREGQILVYQVPIPEPLRFLEPRETETRTHARAGGIRPDARQALRGHRPPRPHRHDLRLPGDGRRPLPDGPLADPEVRQSEDAPMRRRCSCSAPAARSASTPCRPTPTVREPRLRGPSLRGAELRASPARSAARRGIYLDEVDHSTTAAGACSSAPTPTTARAAGRARGDGGMTPSGRRSAILLERRGLDQALRRADRLPRRRASTSGPARCWPSSANPARASRRCSTASPAGSRPTPARSATACATARSRDLFGLDRGRAARC